MPARERMHEAGGEPSPTNLVLRSPPNWTAVVFLAGLGALHLTVWAIAVMHEKADAYMSLAFGTGFLLASLACYLTSFEVMVIPSERRLRLRTGYSRFRMERSIPFSHVHAVRLTLTPDPDHATGRVELVCHNENIACPPTQVARVEALCLAVTMGVRLVKVTDGRAAHMSRRRTREAKLDELSAS